MVRNPRGVFALVSIEPCESGVLQSGMLFIGTSGFSYDDWKGCWYPPDLAKAKMFDYYAERFNAVEINSTFYYIPGPQMMDSLARRGQKRVTFSLKMTQLVTHEGDLSADVVQRFNRAVQPGLDDGTLKAVLAQFPNRFHWNPANREYLVKVLKSFGHLPMVVEIRHSSWQESEALDFFRNERINLAILDMPRFAVLPQDDKQLIGDMAYVRFHGRNYQKWFTAESSMEPYDYYYSQEELSDWIEPIKQYEKKSETTFAFFNNHVRGQGPHNAEMLKTMLGEPSVKPGYEDLFTGLV